MRAEDSMSESKQTIAQERDELREEVEILRMCVSCHIHGSAQGLANAYARLKRFDETRRTRASGDK
jgi:hypothetical protein